MTIAALSADDVEACLTVVRSLPEWFGYPGALEGVARAIATQEGFVAVEHEAVEQEKVIGFVTVTSKFAETLEITYLAVHREHRRAGIGRRLVAQVAALASARGVESITLLTLGPKAESRYYEESVAFYRSLGFWRTNELSLSDWGGAPALIMTCTVAHLSEGWR